ncbi:MAG: MFS transporter, partial [Lysobacterales bacterium]
ALASYWLHAARSPAPLFPLSLFRVRTYGVGVIGNLFARLGSGGMPYLIPLLLQVALGYPAAHAGMMMIPIAAAAMFSKHIVVPLVRRFGYRQVLVVNTVLTGLVMASFALIEPGRPLALHVAHFALFGAVNSVQFTAMNTLTLRDLGGEQASAGNSLLSMVMMLAVSLGVAAAGGLLAAFSGAAGGDGDAAPVLTAFRWTFLCVGTVTAISSVIFAQIGDTRRIPDQVVEASETG